MSASPTYRVSAAIILLFLYGIIAAPVQIWHQHLGLDRNLVTVVDKENHVVQEDNETASHYCSICSHQFASYIDAGLHINIKPPVAISPAANEFPNAGWTGFALPTQFNKGPPLYS